MELHDKEMILIKMLQEERSWLDYMEIIQELQNLRNREKKHLNQKNVFVGHKTPVFETCINDAIISDKIWFDVHDLDRFIDDSKLAAWSTTCDGSGYGIEQCWSVDSFSKP